ncbi:MAG: hypothetical protein H6818_17475 [Phycisphaerales bacterium]|nr:hypothetical protein [Phycisphaerales bacterium]MCB9864580.1 hypothetical protein [Phycisphaerales bacterium]
MTRFLRPLVAVLLSTSFVHQSIASADCQPEATGFAAGLGTPEDPYQICSAAQLNRIRNHMSSHFVLIADIELSCGAGTSSPSDGNTWDPLGSWADANNPADSRADRVATEFTGSLNGKNHVINNLKIDRPGVHNLGLFGAIGEKATVIHVHFTNVVIRGDELDGGGITAGALAAHNYGHVKNVTAQGTVIMRENAGGIVGYNHKNAIVTDCQFEGHSETRISNHAGGIVGNNYGVIQHCRANAVVMTEPSWAGGIAGGNHEGGVISECYSDGEVSGFVECGGIVGVVDTGSILRDSYSHASVTGFEVLGGVAGFVWTATAENCYATGKVNGSYHNGGILGGEMEGTTLIGLVWDAEASENDVGVSNFSVHTPPDLFDGKSTAEMMTRAAYGNTWDFETIWAIDDGNDYPRLRAPFGPMPAVNDSVGDCTQTDNFVDDAVDNDDKQDTEAIPSVESEGRLFGDAGAFFFNFGDPSSFPLSLMNCGSGAMIMTPLLAFGLGRHRGTRRHLRSRKRSPRAR